MENKSIITNALLRKAMEKAHYERMHSNNCAFIRKRDRQYKLFSEELTESEEQAANNVCPRVPRAELKNMPSDTYVIMDGTGRDFYANFTHLYSGRAGTKEQCLDFVNRYYDKNADWEFLPTVVSIEEYFKNYA